MTGMMSRGRAGTYTSKPNEIIKASSVILTMEAL